MEIAATADVITVNKTEEDDADSAPPPVKPASQRTRRRAAVAVAGRRSQRVKRRGALCKRRGTGEKRRGPKDKKRGQEETEGVTVKRTWSGGKRRWDKKHYCVFCRRPQVKIARHLLRKHGDQQEVMAASSLPTGSKQRHLLLEHLRCRGNYLHNIEVIRQGSGEIVPCRQPSEEVDARSYLPCPLCLGFFLRADLWKHQASCRKKLASDQSTDHSYTPESASEAPKDLESSGTCDSAEDGPTESIEEPAEHSRTKRASEPSEAQSGSSDPGADRPRKRTRVQAAASRLLPISSGASESCSEVLHRMNQDHVSHQVKSDWLICKYGNKLMGNQDGNHRRYDYVSQKLRELGRFLLAAKALDSEVHTLQDVLSPGRLGLALAAARKASGYRWSRPPLAVKTTLKTVCEIAIGESLQDGDWEAAAKTTDFYHMLGRDWDNLGLQSLDPDLEAPEGGPKLKKRIVQSRSENKSKSGDQEQPDPGPEALSKGNNRPLSSMIPLDGRLQSPLTSPLTVPMVPKKVRRRPWSTAEKEAVWRQLGVHVLVQSVPGKEVCQRCLDLEPVLRGRHWKDIKNQVHNQIQSQKKQQFHAQMDLQGNQEQRDQIQNQKKQLFQTSVDQQAKNHSQNQKKCHPQIEQHNSGIQNQRKQQYHLQMDHQDQDHIQNQKKQQYHLQMNHQDQESIQKQKHQYHLQLDHPPSQDQDHNQNQKKQQYHLQLDHQDQEKKQQYHLQMGHQDQEKKQNYHLQMDHQDQEKKQQYHTQMDHQDQEKKQQYHTQMDHQDHLQIHKKQLCHTRLDHQDHLTVHKKQLYQIDQATLDQDTSILTASPFGHEGSHRAPGHSLVERDPIISPYPLQHRAPGPLMDQMLSRTEWNSDGTLAQNFPIRHLARNLLQEAPPGALLSNPHSGHVHF